MVMGTPGYGKLTLLTTLYVTKHKLRFNFVRQSQPEVFSDYYSLVHLQITRDHGTPGYGNGKLTLLTTLYVTKHVLRFNFVGQSYIARSIFGLL